MYTMLSVHFYDRYSDSTATFQTYLISNITNISVENYISYLFYFGCFCFGGVHFGYVTCTSKISLFAIFSSL